MLLESQPPANSCLNSVQTIMEDDRRDEHSRPDESPRDEEPLDDNEGLDDDEGLAKLTPEQTDYIDALMSNQHDLDEIEVPLKRIPGDIERRTARWAKDRTFGAAVGMRRFAIMAELDPDGFVAGAIGTLDPERGGRASVRCSGYGSLGAAWEIHIRSSEGRAKCAQIYIPIQTERARIFEDTGRARIIHRKIGRPDRVYEFNILGHSENATRLFEEARNLTRRNRAPLDHAVAPENTEDFLLHRGFDTCLGLGLPSDEREMAWCRRWWLGSQTVAGRLTESSALLREALETDDLKQLPAVRAFLQDALPKDPQISSRSTHHRAVLWRLRALAGDAPRFCAMEFELTAIRAGWKGKPLAPSVTAAIDTARDVISAALTSPELTKNGLYHCAIDLGEPGGPESARRIEKVKTPGSQMTEQADFWEHLPRAYPRKAIAWLGSGAALLQARDGNRTWLDWWKTNQIEHEERLPAATRGLLQEAAAMRERAVPSDAPVRLSVGPFFGCTIREERGSVLFRWHGLLGCWFVELQPELGLIEGEFRVTFDKSIGGRSFSKEASEWRELNPEATDEETWAKFGNPDDWVGTEARSSAFMHFVSAAILRDFWVTVEGTAFEQSDSHRRRDWDRALGSSMRFVYLPRMKHTRTPDQPIIDPSALKNLEQILNWPARAKHHVEGHGRYVKNPSEKQVNLAKEQGFHLLPGQTYVRGHDRGSDETKNVVYKSRTAMRAIMGDLISDELRQDTA